MKIRKPYKARWFYGLSSQGEMIIDNNQNKIARLYSLNQGVISACLRGERKDHKGWRFTLVENLRPFVAIEKKESDARHMDAATAAGIRHLAADLYPQWQGIKADGYIFTGYKRRRQSCK